MHTLSRLRKHGPSSKRAVQRASFYRGNFGGKMCFRKEGKGGREKWGHISKLPFPLLAINVLPYTHLFSSQKIPSSKKKSLYNYSIWRITILYIQPKKKTPPSKKNNWKFTPNAFPFFFLVTRGLSDGCAPGWGKFCGEGGV